MGTRRLRTANYSHEARTRLGDAVTKAREAAGYRWRTEFAPVAGISVRVLAAIEQAEPTVGQAALHAVARALPRWTEDTPREILEGGEIPSNDLPLEEPARPADDVNLEMLAHLHEQYRDLGELEGTAEEIAEILDLLKKMWHKREPDIGRFRRTVERFAAEIDQQELAERDGPTENGETIAPTG